MTEHEPIIELTPRKRKDKVIFEAKEEPVKTSISRESYRQQLMDRRDYHQDQIDQIEAELEKIEEELREGKIVRYCEEKGCLSHESKEKPPLGFPRPKSTKDAATWKDEEKKRQAKKG